MKLLEKRNYIILFIIIILILFLIFSYFNRKIEYTYTYNYFDHNFVIKIYENKDIYNDIDKIFKNYEKMINGENDKLLTKIIKFSQNIYKKSAGYIDASIKNFKEDTFQSKINDLSLDSLDTSIIIGPVITTDIVNYLKENNIYKYLISDNGNITAGNHYNNEKYKVSIENPNNHEILKIVKFNNKSMVTINKNMDNYSKNPIEKKITRKYDTVVVIAKNIEEASFLAHTFYLKDEEDGQKFIKENNASILYLKEGKLKTINFDKYLN